VGRREGEFYLLTINFAWLGLNNVALLKADLKNCELSALNPLHGCLLADCLTLPC
jgi:hypothetical protein